MFLFIISFCPSLRETYQLELLGKLHITYVDEAGEKSTLIYWIKILCLYLYQQVAL